MRIYTCPGPPGVTVTIQYCWAIAFEWLVTSFIMFFPEQTKEQLPLEPQKLWSPSDSKNTEMEKFRNCVNGKFRLHLRDYSELYQWSCDNIALFWETVWTWTGIVSSKPYTTVVDESASMETIPVWFQGARLNYAENLLWCRDDRTAIYATGEQGNSTRVSYKELYERVRVNASAMRNAGVKAGDRVAGYVPNCPEAVVCMLAAASLGAIWSSTSPDFGTTGVLDRFAQIKPKILFSVNAVVYNGKVLDHLAKLKAVVQGLSMLEKVVIIPFVRSHPLNPSDVSPIAMTLEAFSEIGDPKDELIFEQLPFNHPLFILFSSGTTGKPKCLVHGAGGMLIQHKKEHMIHGGMTPDDVFFQYTTTGWMMWNWLVAGLSVGAAIVLFDGSPFKPDPSVLWRLVDELGITIFGTSAKYVQSLQDVNYCPKNHHNLSTLHSFYSTGSPLKPESFDFIYESISSKVLLGSITGGTDICSLFAGHNAALPVYRGEIQCRCLGMKIESWDGEGKAVYGKSGDLVCRKAFPAMPLYFLEDETNAKYRAAYFDNYKGVWYHGDYVWINGKTGGVVMLGRSDGTLNPAGVRFGSAEIYNIVDSYKEVADSIVVGQTMPDILDERVVLFLKMRDGKAAFTQEFVEVLKKRIRNELSPRHVPSVFLPVEEIPYTVNGKKVEIAVKKIVSGQTYVPSGTLANPECLQYFYDIPLLRAA